ncbi:MAG: TMEM43 family protein, partial [Candidatus Latescibacterota bacterium]|nr:TMEM43 family protein [Candidatus Latescibacterota bacterium]
IAAMAIGLGMLFKILSTVIDRIPFVGIHIGTVVGVGTSLIAILIALPLALLTIAIAWFFVRPILSISLLVIATGSFFGLRKFGGK